MFLLVPRIATTCHKLSCEGARQSCAPTCVRAASSGLPCLACLRDREDELASHRSVDANGGSMPAGERNVVVASDLCEDSLQYTKNVTEYKGSAPRAADAARYARSRQGRMQLKTCKGGRKKRPMIWCEQRFDNAKRCLCRANCPVVLSCAVLLLPVLRSDQQYGGNLRGGKNRGA